MISNRIIEFIFSPKNCDFFWRYKKKHLSKICFFSILMVFLYFFTTHPIQFGILIVALEFYVVDMFTDRKMQPAFGMMTKKMYEINEGNADDIIIKKHFFIINGFFLIVVFLFIVF